MEMLCIFSMITLFLHKEKIFDDITGKLTVWTQIGGYLVIHAG